MKERAVIYARFDDGDRQTCGNEERNSILNLWQQTREQENRGRWTAGPGFKVKGRYSSR